MPQSCWLCEEQARQNLAAEEADDLLSIMAINDVGASLAFLRDAKRKEALK